MRLKGISITNFRSITSTENLELNNYSILIGRNNEGKTNVLKAITYSIAAIKRYKVISDKRVGRMRSPYRFRNDYPLSLIENESAKPTEFVVTFQLNPEDVVNFKKKVGIDNNGSISIRIVFEKKTNNVDYSIAEKRGKGATSYKQHMEEIMAFLSQNIVFQYVPAIRTQQDSLDVLTNLVRHEIGALSNDEDYNRAVEIIKNKKKQLLDELNKNVFETIKRFIPSIRATRMEPGYNFDGELIEDEEDGVELYVDDGIETDLDSKGDGVKSIVTMALLNGVANSSSFRIVAIEEPESHLHSEAIHQVETVLKELSANTQVIITTHSPVFVNRKDISSNIVVDKGTARKAVSLDSIRELLGIKLSDNLYSTDKMIIVEGTDDEKSLKHIFSMMSNKIKRMIDGKYLGFSDLGGSSNLKYKTSLLSYLMIDYYVILDCDKAGRTAYKECIQKGLITAKNTFLIPVGCSDDREVEFEDCLNERLYKAHILTNYGVDIDCVKLKNKNKKWSDRIKELFKKCGKEFDESIEAKLKAEISDLIVQENDIANILNAQYLDVFKNIISCIESEL